MSSIIAKTDTDKKYSKVATNCCECYFYNKKDDNCGRGLDEVLNIAGKEHHLFPCSQKCFLSKRKYDLIINKYKNMIEEDFNELIICEDSKVSVELNCIINTNDKQK